MSVPGSGYGVGGILRRALLVAVFTSGGILGGAGSAGAASRDHS